METPSGNGLFWSATLLMIEEKSGWSFRDTYVELYCNERRAQKIGE